MTTPPRFYSVQIERPRHAPGCAADDTGNAGRMCTCAPTSAAPPRGAVMVPVDPELLTLGEFTKEPLHVRLEGDSARGYSIAFQRANTTQHAAERTRPSDADLNDAADALKRLAVYEAQDSLAFAGRLDDLAKRLRIAALSTPPRPSAEPVALDVEAVIRAVAELPDRSSPEEWPEAMLVTGDELRRILATPPAAAQDTGDRPFREHGCMTGDCPHSDQRECDKALADEYRHIAKERA